MKAGFFSTIITPPIGTMQAGGYNPAYIKGIAGPLKVRAAIFETEGKRVAIAGIDCCSLGKELIDKAFEYAKSMGELQLDSFIISASHTHSGAAVSSARNSEISKKMDPDVLALSKNSALADPWFTDWVSRQLATALIMAARNVEPAIINTGLGEESGYMFNRRLFCKDGRTYSHPGKMNPDIVGPAGPVDPSVGVLGAWREDGSLIGAIVNFSCHGTTYSGPNAHADWYYYVEETLQKLFGQNAGVVVLNGPCGDVTQVNNQSRTRDFGLDISKRLGFRVGAEAAKILIAAPKQKDPTLASMSENIHIKRRVPRPESIARSWELVNAHKSDPSHPDAVFARERLIAGELARVEPEKTVPLAAIQIGDVIFLSNPAEYFTSLSLRIKASTPFKYTMVVELANDKIGYVPDKAAFDTKTGGGYETVLTAYSCLIPDAGDMIADELIKMSKNFTPDQVAEDEPVGIGSYWDYGRRGPDND